MTNPRPRLPVSADVLATELKAARRGRGLYHPDIAGRVGPAMRAAFGLTDVDAAAVARSKMIRRVQEGSRSLPEELQLAVLGALGIHQDVRDMMLLQDRVAWLAGRIHKDNRTARRRIDEGCERLAEILVGGSEGRRSGRLAGDDWYVESFHAILVLDSGSPMTIERRVVVAERDGLDRLALPWSLPRAEAAADGHDLRARVLYGGALTGKERESDSRFRLSLTLPRPLRAGETHEYGLLIEVPPEQPMRTHYIYFPATRCDFFDLRVRFGVGAPPERVWRVADAFHRDVDERRLDSDLLTVDRAGDVHVQFFEMALGHGYGIQWGGPTSRTTP
jgi:hypothetical protein